jgi:hypothetical protein
LDLSRLGLTASVFKVSALISRSSSVSIKSFRVFDGVEESGGGVTIAEVFAFFVGPPFCGP